MNVSPPPCATSTQIFFAAPLVEPPGRYSMDWYYPVLGGALRGQAGYERLVEGRRDFLGEGVGCRCVRDRPWYTVAETCELIIALDTCGLTDRARDLFEWVHTLRQEDGSYWTGITHPDGQLWPVERLSWTAATVILAAVTLAGDAPTSRFFRELDADGSKPPHGRHARATRRLSRRLADPLHDGRRAAAAPFERGAGGPFGHSKSPFRW